MTQPAEFDPHELIEQQARGWVIRLDGDEPLDDAQRRALERWINQSAAHRDTLLRLARHWKQANELTELVDAAPASTFAAEPSGSRRPKPWIWVTAAVGLAAIAIEAWPGYWGPWGVNGTYATAVGEQRTVRLPDGSLVELNTNSQVEIDYGAHMRGIRLNRGEALFEVAHDATRPFVVYAANQVVRAVGTAFAVHVEAGAVDVTVTSGAVEVAESNRGTPDIAPSQSHPGSSPSRSLGQLKAGQATTVLPSTQSLDVRELAPTELARRIAWRDGFLAFSGESLGEVVEQLNRYSPARLEIADTDISTIPIGGRFRVGDLDAVLGVLRDNFGIESKRIDEHTIRLQRASGSL